MLCGSEKGIRSIVAAKSSGVTARLCLGSLVSRREHECIGHIDHDLSGPVGTLCCNLLAVQKANGEEDDVRVECPIDRSGNNVRPELSGYFRS
jgi:hypothetical protein